MSGRPSDTTAANESAPAAAEPALPPASRPRRLVLRALTIAAGLAGVWLGGLVWFAVTMPTEIADPDTPTDAIVVLTGGTQRLDRGLDLLAAGKAKKLFVSGVHSGVEIADLLRVSHPVPDWIACCIVLGHEASSTLGNAFETASWMRREGYTSLRLVTASYHMRRSLLEFGRAMPDIHVVAHPVFPELVKQAEWWATPAAALLLIGEYDKYLGALLRALLAEPVEAVIGDWRDEAGVT